jgi:hypothetical protein
MAAGLLSGCGCVAGHAFFWSPAYDIWLEAVRRVRPDLYTAFNPWDRVTTPEAVRTLLHDGGAPSADVAAEDGYQALLTPEDFWTMALGSGLRWTIDQMGTELSGEVKQEILDRLSANGVDRVETNVIYAIAEKQSGPVCQAPDACRLADHASKSNTEAVQGAWNSLTALLQDMGVDHGRGKSVVAEQLLHGTHVGAALEQGGGAGMAKGAGKEGKGKQSLSPLPARTAATASPVMATGTLTYLLARTAWLLPGSAWWRTRV